MFGLIRLKLVQELSAQNDKQAAENTETNVLVNFAMNMAASAICAKVVIHGMG